MPDREPGPLKPKVMNRREFLALSFGVMETFVGYTAYRTDSLSPEVAKVITMSGVMTPLGLLIGRMLGLRSSIGALIYGHVGGATSLLFQPPQKFKDR